MQLKHHLDGNFQFQVLYQTTKKPKASKIKRKIKARVEVGEIEKGKINKINELTILFF